MTTEAEIVRALRHRYSRERNGRVPAWVFVGQCTVGTSFGLKPYYDHEAPMFREQPALRGSANRLDGFAMHTWHSRGFERHAFEIKCSRADLRNELAAPAKRAAGMALSNRFYFVLDAAVTTHGLELPEDCGVIRFTQGRLRISRQAPHRDVAPPPISFMASVLRTAQRETH